MPRLNKSAIIRLMSRAGLVAIFAMAFFVISAGPVRAEGLTGPNSPSKWDNINKDGGVGSGTELSCKFDDAATVFCENNETATNHNATKYYFDPVKSAAAGYDIFTPSNYGPDQGSDNDNKAGEPDKWGVVHFPESATGNYGLLYISKSSTEWDGGTKENDVDTANISNAPDDAGICSIDKFRGDKEKTVTCDTGWTDPPESVTATYKTTEPQLVKKCDKGGLGFVLCPIQEALVDVVKQLNEWLIELLDINTNSLNNQDLRDASQSLLNIANAFYAIIFLIIIFANGLSIGLDSYALKKMVPRLVAAIILSQFAFFITGAFIELGNVLGATISAFFLQLSSAAASGTAGGAAAAATLTATAVAGALVVFVAITMIIIIIIAILIVLAVLAIRLAGLYVLVLVAPLAFAAKVLPNTEKLFKAWSTNLVKLVMMFPIIMAITSGSAFIGTVMTSSSNAATIQIIGALVPFIGFLMVPKAFKWSGGLMAATGGKLASWGTNKGKAAGKDWWGKEGGKKDRLDAKYGGKVPTKLGPISDFGRKERLKRTGVAESRIKKEREGWTSGLSDDVLMKEARDGKGATKDTARKVLQKKYDEELEKQESRAAKGLPVDATKLVQLRSAVSHGDTVKQQQMQTQEGVKLGNAVDSYMAGKDPATTARPEITYKQNPAEKDPARQIERHYFGGNSTTAPVPGAAPGTPPVRTRPTYVPSAVNANAGAGHDAVEPPV